MPDSFALQLQLTKRQTLGENIAAALREAMFDRVFQAGQRLTEEVIASQLNVSRAPVRDALTCLEQEGLVTRTSNRGAMVALLSREDMEEICSLRLSLEVLAIRLAIRTATEERLTQLQKMICVQAKPVTPDQLAVLDLQFHEHLVRFADHGRLLKSWSSLRSQIRLIMVQRNLADPNSPRETVRQHTEILEAIRARDEKRALSLIEYHLQNQYTWFVNGFPADGAAD